MRVVWSGTGVIAGAFLIACGASAKERDTAGDPIAFVAARDRTLSVSVPTVLINGQKGFLPKDRSWLQIRVIVENVSKRPAAITEIRSRLSNGTVVPVAQSGVELAKPPSIAGSVAKSGGIMAAGQIAGMLIFPPLAIASGVVGMVSMLGGHGSWKKRLELIDQSMLQPQTIAPGTRVEGDVYAPAVRGQSILLFYTLDGRQETLTVYPVGVEPPPIAEPSASASTAPPPSPRPRTKRRSSIRRK